MVSAPASAPSSPLAIKAELVALLGPRCRSYWKVLSDFLKAKISRIEFEELVTEWINTTRLVNLHNSLLSALIYSASASLNLESLDVNGGPKPRSRRRLLAHEKDVEVPRLRRWAVDLGRQERERIRNTVGAAARGGGRGKRGDVAATPGLRSEIRSERGVRLMKERGNPPGTHLAIPLCEITRVLPTQQNLFDRMSLIASQHDMTSSKTAVALLMTSLDVSSDWPETRALTESICGIFRLTLSTSRVERSICQHLVLLRVVFSAYSVVMRLVARLPAPRLKQSSPSRPSRYPGLPRPHSNSETMASPNYPNLPKTTRMRTTTALI
ncbi:hypothetical protein FRC12_020961 [Ceratobasidium sp. 428]|nr:hypothetical protein FRC12_020961 [Ceratobasidium sp. 428]